MHLCPHHVTLGTVFISSGSHTQVLSTPPIVLEAERPISQCAGGTGVSKQTVAIILDQCESSGFSPLSGGDGRIWKTQGLC